MVLPRQNPIVSWTAFVSAKPGAPGSTIAACERNVNPARSRLRGDCRDRHPAARRRRRERGDLNELAQVELDDAAGEDDVGAARDGRREEGPGVDAAGAPMTVIATMVPRTGSPIASVGAAPDRPAAEPDDYGRGGAGAEDVERRLLTSLIARIARRA